MSSHDSYTTRGFPEVREQILANVAVLRPDIKEQCHLATLSVNPKDPRADRVAVVVIDDGPKDEWKARARIILASKGHLTAAGALQSLLRDLEDLLARKFECQLLDINERLRGQLGDELYAEEGQFGVKV